MRLISRHPEMPNEPELNREYRKQLSELMLEYLTELDNQEEEEQEEEHLRYYMPTMRETFKTPIGRPNHPQTPSRMPTCTSKRSVRKQMPRNAIETFEDQKRYENTDNM